MGFLTASPKVIPRFSFYANSQPPSIRGAGKFNHPWDCQRPQDQNEQH